MTEGEKLEAVIRARALIRAADQLRRIADGLDREAQEIAQRCAPDPESPLRTAVTAGVRP